ncbi:NUDIX hydrolase [Patescibacteria group bacterium]|nr:NUDIX hydrolase [Patescibacteria group bacterium]
MNTYKLPISIKGIVFEGNFVWLRKNERDGWELPGGKMDEGEQPEETVIRELREELGFETKIVDIIQSYLYIIKASKDESRGVLVVSYLCKLVRKVGDFEFEGEAGKSEFKKFSIKQIDKLKMTEFYKIAIKKAWKDKVN